MPMLQKHHGLTCGCRHLTVLSQEAKLGPLDLPKFNMEPRKLAVACWDMLSLGGVPLQFLKKTIDYPPQKNKHVDLCFMLFPSIRQTTVVPGRVKPCHCQSTQCIKLRRCVYHPGAPEVLGMNHSWNMLGWWVALGHWEQPGHNKA